MKPKTRFNLTYAIIALLCVWILQGLWVGSTIETISYSDFLEQLRAGNIEQVVVSPDEIQGLLKEPLESGRRAFTTTRVDPEIADALVEHGVEVAGRLESTWLITLLSWVVPVLLFVGLWLFVFRHMADRVGGGGGLMAVGKSKARVYVEANTGVSFDDVAGVDEAKQELREIVEFLKDPKNFGRLGARMPKGVLLVGPPGTGKTLLARAVAGEAGVPFFSISGSEFVEMFVGVGAARVRDLFEQARKKAPCIIFIDELDALGAARGQRAGFGGHDEKEQTLNQLLVELDGFDPASGIVLLAATNRPDVLDPALLRAGRFDRQVLVDRPDRRGREQILRVHVRKVKLADGVPLEDIAAMTAGFSGADLANLVNEAALAATRRGAKSVERRDFDTAFERIVAGLERKNRLLNPRERRIVAVHEIGHALVATASPHVDPVQKISIIPRGIGALGYTLQRPTEDRFLMTREELEDKLAVLQGGRAAEKLVFGHLSTGAADDLSKATDIARKMAVEYAMVEELGHVAYESEPAPFLGTPHAARTRLYAETTAREIDEAVRAILEKSYKKALEILESNRDTLERAAEELLEKETLDENDLSRLLSPVRMAEQPAEPVGSRR